MLGFHPQPRDHLMPRSVFPSRQSVLLAIGVVSWGYRACIAGYYPISGRGTTLPARLRRELRALLSIERSDGAPVTPATTGGGALAPGTRRLDDGGWLIQGPGA